MSDKILVCGGPHHGQIVDDAGKIWSPLVMMQDTNSPETTPFAAPTNYFRRWVEGVTPDSGRVRRAVYAHESIQNPNELMQALASVLIASWVEDGGEAVLEPTEIKLDPNPRPVSGLILPGQ